MCYDWESVSFDILYVGYQRTHTSETNAIQGFIWTGKRSSPICKFLQSDEHDYMIHQKCAPKIEQLIKIVVKEHQSFHWMGGLNCHSFLCM